MWSSLALKKPKEASVVAGSCLGDCHTGDQTQKFRWIKGYSVLEETGLGQAFMGSDLAYPVTFCRIHDVLSLLERQLMKLAISFLRALSSQLKFMEVKSLC